MFQVLPYIGCRNDAKANLHCPGQANSGAIPSRPKAKGLTWDICRLARGAGIMLRPRTQAWE